MAKKNGSNGDQARPALDIPVEFGGVSIGQATARLGVRINRNVLNLIAADETFCGHRLDGVAVLGGQDDQPGQQTFWEDLEHQVKGVFDVKRIGVSREQIVTGLTFSLSDIDVSELAKLSKGAGRLIIHTVMEIPDGQAFEEHDSDDDDVPDTLLSDGPWREVSLDELFIGAIRAALHEADIDTVGELHDWTASKKLLTDIKGIGPGKAAQIEDRILQFWSDNPQYCDGKEGEVDAEEMVS